MTDGAAIPKRQTGPVLLWAAGGVGALLLAAGLAGGLSGAVGYGLLLAAAVALLVATVLFGIFALSRRPGSDVLKQAFGILFLAGAGLYVIGFCALLGHLGHEALQGRLALRWIIFWPAAAGALAVLDYGLYRKLVSGNLPTFQRFGGFMTRERNDASATRRVLVDEVILHRTLWSASRFRWLRHTLIFWGFTVLFATELFAVLFREILPSLGYGGLWADGRPLRLAHDFLFEISGLAVLAGCILALIFRYRVRGTPDEKYTDTPASLFLLAVVLSGFIVEALRMAAAPGATDAVSFVGYAMAGIPGLAGLYASLYEPLWYVHVLGSCLFIALVPARRLVHSCATPMGRLMGAQKGMLEARRRGVLGGLLPGSRRD